MAICRRPRNAEVSRVLAAMLADGAAQYRDTSFVRYELTTQGRNEAKRVADGEQALAIAREYRPDLILLDIMMPKISGFDVLDILRNTPETGSIKIIVLTALSQEKDRKRAEDLGADDFLVKSQVVIADVVGRIRHHLDMN